MNSGRTVFAHLTENATHKEADTVEDCAARAFRHESAENELLTRTGCLDRIGSVR